MTIWKVQVDASGYWVTKSRHLRIEEAIAVATALDGEYPGSRYRVVEVSDEVIWQSGEGEERESA